MASLSSVSSLSSSLKLEPEFAKYSTKEYATDKSMSISYRKNHAVARLDSSSVSRSLDFREALVMLKDNKEVESSCYVPLLQECIDRNSVSQAQVAHGHIIKTGSYRDLYVMTFLINVYAKCGTMENARKLVYSLPRGNAVVWTTLMTGYVRNSQQELAIQIFLEMLEAGDYPTNITLGVALNACASLQSSRLGKQVHAYVVKSGVENDTSIGNALCSLYSRLGSLVSAMRAFENINDKNVISWTSVISACNDNGYAAKGLRYFTEMLSKNVRPNEYAVTSVLSLCSTMLSLGVGVQIHSLCIKLGYESQLLIRNSLMYLYMRCGWIDDAQKLFDRMESKSLVTWNAFIAGHAQLLGIDKNYISTCLIGTEAIKIFLRLKRSGLKPDLYTFSSILNVCSSMAGMQQGEQIHAQTIKTGFLSDVVVGTALVNMYSKCGSTGNASKIFMEMPTRTLISWTSMITGFAQHGQYQQALHLFDDMRIVGVRPNRITFVGVLSACSHAGMIREALDYFEMMQKDYKIKPVIDHYACLIEMFVRLGRFDEAFEFIKKMEHAPNEYIWSTFIKACTSHGKPELGLYAAEQLLKLKLKDIESYVSLSKMYRSAERWDDVSKVRKLMKEVGKLHDWSWISIKDRVYSFKPNDQRYIHNSDICRLLESLLDKAKSLGYYPQQSLEMADGADEEFTLSSAAYHSEKLAIAFGLLNTASAAPIRVSKNISMSRDSHSFVKCISQMTNREIIIRDSKCLHKFVKGHCSCGDHAGLL